MADVFISYAKEDRESASRLADALAACGWSVWWDQHLRSGTGFDRVIEAELEAARCVVVLWSPRARESQWVRNEASAAVERGVLVSLSLERTVHLPIEFRHIHTRSVAGWSGRRSEEQFQDLLLDLSHHLGSVPGPGEPPDVPDAPAPTGTPQYLPDRFPRSVGAVFGLLVAMPPVGIWYAMEGLDQFVATGLRLLPVSGLVIGTVLGASRRFSRGFTMGAGIGALGMASVYLARSAGAGTVVAWSLLGGVIWGIWGVLLTGMAGSVMGWPIEDEGQ